MPPRKTDSPTGDNDVVEVLHLLTEEVRVLRDVLDEIREEMSWSIRNNSDRRNECTVLKQMGRDPTADDWGEHLVIARHDGLSESNAPNQSEELEAACDVIGDQRARRRRDENLDPSQQDDSDESSAAEKGHLFRGATGSNLDDPGRFEVEARNKSDPKTDCW